MLRLKLTFHQKLHPKQITELKQIHTTTILTEFFDPTALQVQTVLSGILQAIHWFTPTAIVNCSRVVVSYPPTARHKCQHFLHTFEPTKNSIQLRTQRFPGCPYFSL